MRAPGNDSFLNLFLKHYLKHREEFGYVSAVEYVLDALAFAGHSTPVGSVRVGRFNSHFGWRRVVWDQTEDALGRCKVAWAYEGPAGINNDLQMSSYYKLDFNHIDFPADIRARYTWAQRQRAYEEAFFRMIRGSLNEVH